ncbi:MAG: PucR family transcriptional regulator ligand-binding domain-containing protein [Nitriliruptoraceae bacterium]
MTAATTASRPLRDVLASPVLADAKVLAGASGLDRSVERLNIMEVPDILPWVKPHELLLTTAYPLRDHPEELPKLVADLDDAGLAGIGIKLGRYLDQLDDAVLDVADSRGFPIIQLPDDVGFDEILHDVLTDILHDQAAKLARSEEIHRAFLALVLGGDGLPEIARDVAGLIDAPCAIVDLDGDVLAAAGTDALGLSSPLETVLLDAGRHLAVVDGRTLPCTCAPITAGPRDHGQVIVLGRDALATDDRLALENAATVAALTITKARELQAVEDKYRSDLVHDLLRGVDDVDDAVRRARSFGWDLERRLITLVVRLDAPGTAHDAPERQPLTRRVSPIVTARDPHAAIVHFSTEAVILTEAFSGTDGRADARTFARRLVDDARAGGVSVSIGMSRPVDDLAGVAHAYEQAVRALHIGRTVTGDGAVAHFDDLGAYRVLSLVEDHRELDVFATEVLGGLRADTPAAADLRATLEVLLDTGGNVAEASRRLHFHYNTLRYRIEKLSQLLGPFMDDARVRLNVQLALLIHAMRDPDAGRPR